MDQFCKLRWNAAQGADGHTAATYTSSHVGKVAGFADFFSTGTKIVRIFFKRQEFTVVGIL